MRTTIDIDDTLMEDVVRLSGAKKKKEALRIALEEYVRRVRIDALLALPGTIEIDYVRPEMEEAELEELRLSLAGFDEPADQNASLMTGKAKVAERRRRYR